MDGISARLQQAAADAQVTASSVRETFIADFGSMMRKDFVGPAVEGALKDCETQMKAAAERGQQLTHVSSNWSGKSATYETSSGKAQLQAIIGPSGEITAPSMAISVYFDPVSVPDQLKKDEERLMSSLRLALDTAGWPNADVQLEIDKVINHADRKSVIHKVTIELFGKQEAA